MEDIIAIILIFGGGTLFALSVSPIGRAIAARIRDGGNTVGPEVEELRESQMALLQDVETMRQELVEVQERVDFAERLLAQHRTAPKLSDPDERT